MRRKCVVRQVESVCENSLPFVLNCRNQHMSVNIISILNGLYYNNIWNSQGMRSIVVNPSLETVLDRN